MCANDFSEENSTDIPDTVEASKAQSFKFQICCTCTIYIEFLFLRTLLSGIKSSFGVGYRSYWTFIQTVFFYSKR